LGKEEEKEKPTPKEKFGGNLGDILYQEYGGTSYQKNKAECFSLKVAGESFKSKKHRKGLLKGGVNYIRDGDEGSPILDVSAHRGDGIGLSKKDETSYSGGCA